MPVITVKTLTEFVSKILQGAGTSPDGARQVANSLVSSNLAGHDSHGVVRVRQYLDTIAAGELDPAAEPVITKETGGIVLVDAQHGFGQIAAAFAMQTAIDKAHTNGLSATGLLNCNHIGRLGEWVEMAARQDMIALCFANGGRPGGLVAPFGGAGRLWGTNPIAAGIPLGGQAPVVMDFATSVVAEGKVRVARNKGQTLPEGWIQRADGQPSTTPDDLYEGGVLLPAAGHKGYGLALLVELIGGLLIGQGGPAMPDYKAMKNGVVFLVVSAGAFRPVADFLDDGATLYDRIKATPPAPGFDEVLLPGEPEQRTAAQRQTEGIPIDDTTWAQLVAAGAEFEVAAPAG